MNRVNKKFGRLGRITCTMINTSNEVKCLLLWEFWIYNFSRRILERVLVGSIVNIRNECLFFWVHGEWNVARNKQIDPEPLCGSRDLFVPRYDSLPYEPIKKDTHSLNTSFCLMNLKFPTCSIVRDRLLTKLYLMKTDEEFLNAISYYFYLGVCEQSVTAQMIVLKFT